MTNLVVDWAGFADNFDNDRFAMSLVVDAFLEAAPEGMTKLRSALDSKDKKAVAMAAHSIKGAILNFGAEEAVRIGQALENLGYEGLTDEAEILYKQLVVAVDFLLAELRRETARYQEAS